MKLYKSCLLISVLLYSAYSSALTITNTINYNNKISGNQYFEFQMIDAGFNPTTDIINHINLTFDIKEIIEDPYEDGDYDDPNREPMMIFDRYLYYRAIFFDVDTGIYSQSAMWYPAECQYMDFDQYGQEQCLFQPDIDGVFYSSWQVHNENLWLNWISFSIDVTRKHVPEPSTLLLFLGGIGLLSIRHRNRWFALRQTFTTLKQV